ncbi:hypothetical protein L484_006404 [Morus notabilis]|uniref:Major facilitator superfamily (MFS) profile domain-containing protein n=1 Tax=Morus notabilis TaxID=981085 RepID=W9R8W9_9ROSA|nr:protein NUCLEAR FUSION DEFECTIVE 4 [Morus notabilis]EXB42058.1 hypothetical protein L484_006404 [Morus notabilis]
MEIHTHLRLLTNSKWMATAASIWIQCAVGPSYTFGIYSPALKASQGYDQSTLDTVSVFKDIGANAGVLSGLLYAAVAAGGRRRVGGPWVVIAAGAVQCFVGYFFMWAAVAGVIQRPPVAAMCLFMFLAAHGQTFFNTSNVVCGVENFSSYSGTIVGILKGFLGLSGAMLIQVYKTICQGKPSTFLLILAILPASVSLSLMLLVRIHESTTTNEKKHLNFLSAVALTISAYLMTLIILDNIFTLSMSARISTFVFLLLLLASPLGIAIKAESENMIKKTPETLSIEIHNPLLVTEGDHKGEDMNILQAMGTVNFWLLFLAMVCGLGSGMATINNMSQLGQSLGYTSLEITSFVSLWSIWNFLGRFGAGFLSDYFLHTRGWARPVLSAATLAAMSAGHIIIASGFAGNLYLGSMLVGICYGSQWSLMPTITSEIFGVRHMGTIFNTIAIASPVGSYILSVRVIGYIYDKEASGNTCFGTHCFMLSFFIMAAVACIGAVIVLALFFRTKRFYELVVLRKLQYASGQGN